MRAEEIDHGGQHAIVAQPAAQFIGRQAGQRQQAFGPVAIGQDPAQRGKRQRPGIGGGGCRFAQNCQSRLAGLDADAYLVRDWRMAKRILVVEDNDLNRKLFCDVLKSQGYAVEPVADGLDALDRARQFVPNLIIMDIQLPNVSGLDLIQQAKADRLLRAIPVLAVTAYAGKGDEERIRDAGADSYLAKPVSIGPFMAAVKGLLEKVG